MMLSLSDIRFESLMVVGRFPGISAESSLAAITAALICPRKKQGKVQGAAD